ncbi:serine hydrolase [Mesorhizobium sp. M1156]|uniref:serine hydrolase n=1 Tax=Mesorhizobium sp. M1156 TaxID=2957064 RepID=UPI00333C01DF
MRTSQEYLPALVDKGLLDLQKLVTHYLPELKATAYKGATVQHLLDMASGVVYDDDYDPFGGVPSSLSREGRAPYGSGPLVE